MHELARALERNVVVDATNRLDREPANGLAALAAYAPTDSLASLWFALGPRGGRGCHVALKLVTR